VQVISNLFRKQKKIAKNLRCIERERASLRMQLASSRAFKGG
jgi:hypothetical protein